MVLAFESVVILKLRLLSIQMNLGSIICLTFSQTVIDLSFASLPSSLRHKKARAGTGVEEVMTKEQTLISF